VDLVLVSHNHYDHLDSTTLQRLDAEHAPTFVTGLGNGAFLREDLGLATVVELDWWETLATQDSRVTFVPAQHWSGRGPGNRNRTLWGGFLIERAGFTLYFAGDSGYGAHFTAIRRHFAPTVIDLALLPIGAYAPRWFMRNQHMDPEDAVLAHRDLGARRSIGTHFGCFQLTDEAIEEPVELLAEARRRHRLQPSDFDVLDTGETREFHAAAAAAAPAGRHPPRRRAG
jgi:L-ascorbate metabolism protein UlaG (beta-lactamase superfamily)